MPIPPTGIPTVVRRSETVIRDTAGEVVATFGSHEMTIQEDPTKPVKMLKQFDTLVMADGTTVGVADLLGKPPIELAVCDDCRHPPYRFPFRVKRTHGLLMRKNAERCCVCGAIRCRKHAVFCSDGRWRCRSCALWYRVRRFIRNLFYKRG